MIATHRIHVNMLAYLVQCSNKITYQLCSRHNLLNAVFIVLHAGINMDMPIDQVAQQQYMNLFGCMSRYDIEHLCSITLKPSL